MFKTFMGPVEEAAAVVYLRPETAQGIYVNYLNVLQSSRQKIPFGIAQIGKALDRKSTRLNSSHGYISYAVFCLKKKKKPIKPRHDCERPQRAPNQFCT